MRHEVGLLRWVREAMARHPRAPRAVKAALASVLAWLIVQPFGGVADQYPYYAPLGAVIAVSSTVADSVRATVRAVVAIAIGAVLAVAVGAVLPGVLALAVVVLVGTLVAGWWRFGDLGGWVPVSALFVLIIGHVDQGGFVLGYLGLTAFGAVVGVAVNAVFPPLPLTPGAYEIAAARRSVASQLDDLADALRRDEPLTPEEWMERYHDVRPHAGTMARLVTRTSDARRVNWRVRRWRQQADQQAAHARALERLSLVVDDLAAVLVESRHGVGDSSAIGLRLDESAAEALEAVASALRADDGVRDTGTDQEAADAVDRYIGVVDERMHGADATALTASAVATALQRVAGSLAAERASRDEGTPS